MWDNKYELKSLRQVDCDRLLLLLCWELFVLGMWHVKLWISCVLYDLNCLLSVSLGEKKCSGQTERERETLTLWKKEEKYILLLTFAWSAVAFRAAVKVEGDRLSFLSSISIHTHTHTFYIYIVAATRLCIAHRKTQHSGPTLYVKGHSSLPGEQ